MSRDRLLLNMSPIKVARLLQNNYVNHALKGFSLPFYQQVQLRSYLKMTHVIILVIMRSEFEKIKNNQSSRKSAFLQSLLRT